VNKLLMMDKRTFRNT